MDLTQSALIYVYIQIQINVNFFHILFCPPIKLKGDTAHKIGK